MNKDFITKPFNIKDLPKDLPFPPSFITNNERQIQQTCEFLQSDKKIMLINGYMGAGKKPFVNFIGTLINQEVLQIKYTCFETTILDDMLLSFFESFRNFVIKGKIHNPRHKAENFTQKINLYFQSITNPILIEIHSFHTILKENKPEVLNFIKHLAKFPNIKIIITGRVFELENFEDADYTQTTVLALTKDNFEKLLRDNDIKNIGIMSNELYKQSRGYFHFLNLTMRIMQLRQIGIGKLLENFSKSLVGYHEFIIKDALSLIDPVSLHLFRLLAVMRIPIHLNLLKSLHMYDEKRIHFFVNNYILSVDGECIYLKDYYREIIERQIQDSVMLKLHKACVELYETQLPLKPLERDLRISRQTMRNEIEYHSMFLPKKVEITTTQPLIVPQLPQINTAKIEPNNVQNTTPLQEETKEEEIEKIHFILDDEAVLDNIANSINTFITEAAEKNELATESNKLDLTQTLNKAKDEETQFNYSNAVILYQSALTKTDDDNFDKFMPTIYIRLAKVYKQMSKWYEALNCYTKAQDYYENVSDNQKVAELKLEIANIYFIVYKQDNAKYILKELEKVMDLPNELRIRVNLLLAKLSDNLNEEYTYYKKSIPLVSIDTDKSITAELYYRYAGVNDEKDDLKTALEYYKKCAEIRTDNNYLSRALASLAELCDEGGKSELAIRYYIQSMEIDNAQKNYNGLYTTSRHLSEIYSSKDEDKSLKYTELAKKYAKELNEPYYMVESSMELGNFYMLRKNFEQALKYFEEAYTVAMTSFSQDNADKIKNKIDYVKKQMGLQ